ncbi:MAG: hypothetical protein NVSMB64_00760 [Candidatus Velthaea sp.]
MTESIAIRRGDHRDRAFVLDLGKRVALTSLSQARPAPPALVQTAYEKLVAYIETREHDLFVALERDVAVGFLLLLRDLPDEVTNSEQAFVAYMAVEPGAQRRGAGAALLAAAEGVARSLGLPFLTLMVTEDNAPARALYERAGFVTERRMMTKAL